MTQLPASIFSDESAMTPEQTAAIAKAQSNQPANQTEEQQTEVKTQPVTMQALQGGLNGTHKTILGVALCIAVVGNQYLSQVPETRFAEAAEMAAKQHSRCFALVQTQPCHVGGNDPSEGAETVPAIQTPATQPPAIDNTIPPADLVIAKEHVAAWMLQGADYAKLRSYANWIEVNQNPPGYPSYQAVRFVLHSNGIH